MILCFSGTGNSRYVADRIALLTSDTVTDMNGLIRQGSMNEAINDSHIVIVTPTYAWRLPRIVEKWLRTEKIIKRGKAWFVMTCGDEIGNAAKYNRRLCESKGLEYMGTAQIVMPENYLAMFEVPREKEAAEIIHKSEPAIDRAGHLIGQRQAFPNPRCGFLDRIKSGIVNPAFYALFVKAKAFRAMDSCVGCGCCVSLCPMNNIRLEGGRPMWGNNCTHCMACICRCPKAAIEYGKKSFGKPRYHRGTQRTEGEST